MAFQLCKDLGLGKSGRVGFVSTLYLDEICSAFCIMLASVLSVHSTNVYRALCARHYSNFGGAAVNKTDKCSSRHRDREAWELLTDWDHLQF